MKRKKDEYKHDDTTAQYLYWTEDDRKWDRIRRLRAGGITEITQEDRALQRSWNGIADPPYREPDVTRPYFWTPRLQSERCQQEEIRRMIVDAKVEGDDKLVSFLEGAYDHLARKTQARVDRLGGVRHSLRKRGYTKKDLHEYNDRVAIVSDYKRDFSNEDEECGDYGTGVKGFD